MEKKRRLWKRTTHVIYEILYELQKRKSFRHKELVGIMKFFRVDRSLPSYLVKAGVLEHTKRGLYAVNDGLIPSHDLARKVAALRNKKNEKKAVCSKSDREKFVDAISGCDEPAFKVKSLRQIKKHLDLAGRVAPDPPKEEADCTSRPPLYAFTDSELMQELGRRGFNVTAVKRGKPGSVFSKVTLEV